MQTEQITQAKDKYRHVKDLRGQVFGRLKVITLAPYSSWLGRKASWICQCECGQSTIIASQALIRGMTRSCGCLRREQAKAFRYQTYEAYRLRKTGEI